MKIFDSKIGNNYPTYFIAEIGSNFDGNLNRAKDLISLAAESGADAVKFQHYTANSLVSDFGFSNMNSINTHQSKWKKKVSEIYNDASLNKDWTEELFNFAHNIGIGFFTSPYSMDLVDYVDKFVDAFKIGSGDITYHQILEKISNKNKPILIATGASEENDVINAMNILSLSNNDICLMQCNTNYTAQESNYSYQNLNVLKKYKELFPKVILGLSCHLKTWTSVIASVSLGARIIEKHFTDDRNRKGPDHNFATTPKEWKSMVEEVRSLESMLGNGVKTVEKNEKSTVIVQQRSIRCNKNIAAGDQIKKSDLDFLRPCPDSSLKPYDVNKVLGKKIKKSMKKGDHFTLKNLQ